MKQRWTLQFEHVGRMREGAVRIAPLMLFTGDNNAGKSYVMALLWGVIALGRELFPESPPENESYQRCEDWLRACIGNETKVGDDEARPLVAWFGDVLNHRRKTLCDAVFGEGRIQPKTLRLRDYCREKPLMLRWNDSPMETARYSRGADYVRFPLPGVKPSRADLYRMIRYLTWNLVMGDLSAPLFQMMSPLNPIPRGEILYLPAARTGFVLMRKQLASIALSGSFGHLEEATLPLSLPTRRFVQRLVGLTHNEQGKYAAIADQLERDIIRGSLRPDAAPLPDYQYRPSGTATTAIPLWLTSSLVTELAPLLMFLRSRDDFRSLIIEEPEAHLHLEMQGRLARALVRLVNSGLPVWLTTHGDSLFQQFSNLVKASALGHNQLSALGMEEQETLKPTEVTAWHFKVQPSGDGRDGTRISPLEVSASGIAATAFNDSLVRLTKETISLNSHQGLGDET
ncbi:AAA family ATPase [Thiocapsa marina]|uniref:Uncharacterized protein n=1 Tax=Thiocapsa marina 5811 TaxID=768671 RepID=F9U6C4_9GAMM|nr:AAA family ATPase [Thiocapsa marina]EGV20697.1 hypothetical protein ThimaDRAFT_0475 [Thiocapsa marina 5811]